MFYELLVREGRRYLVFIVFVCGVRGYADEAWLRFKKEGLCFGVYGRGYIIAVTVGGSLRLQINVRAGGL